MTSKRTHCLVFLFIALLMLNAAATGANATIRIDNPSLTPGPLVEGATCENPFWITLPLTGFTGDTDPMGDNYTKDMISPPSFYIDGNDMVLKFTITESGLLFGDMTASDSYFGVFIMHDCPDPNQPALLDGWSTSYTNTLTIPSENPAQPQEVLLLPGDYYIIVSSYPPPQTIAFTLNLWFEPLEGCPQPLLPFVNSITAGSASLGWTEAGTASQWDILFGETGFNPETEGALIQGITGNPYELDELVANTGYDFYVRSVCDTEVVSAWTGPKTFITECDYAFSTAFSEGFESEHAPAECWQMWYDNPDPPDENLMKHSSEESYSGSRAFKFSSSVSGPPYDQYLRTPALDFEDSLHVSLMYLGQDNAPVTFALGTSQDGVQWTWQTSVTDANGIWKEYSIMLPPGANFIAVHYEGTYLHYLFLDDFTVQPVYHPSVNFNPENFSFSVSQGVTETDELCLANQGQADLIYSAYVSQRRADLKINSSTVLTVAKDTFPVDSAGKPGSGIVLHYDGENADGIGIQNGGTLMVAAMFPAELTQQFVGYSLKSADVFLTSGPEETRLIIWGAGNASGPGPILHEQNFQPEEFSWNDVNLSSPVEISGEDLWIGYEVSNEAGGWPAGIDGGPAVQGGDWVYLNDQWARLSEISTFNGNFNIRANLSASDFWLTISPESGIVSPGASDIINLAVNASVLELGTYETTIIINSNDPVNQVIRIPVVLDVLTGVHEFSKASIFMYPVPATDHLNIESSRIISNIEIYNAEGIYIRKIRVDNSTSLHLNTGAFSAGAYLAKIHFRDGCTLWKKFMIR